LNEKQIRLEELLQYCRDQGLDSETLKYTQPDYYIENVQVSSYDNEKIKEMMRNVDRKVVAKFFSGAYDPEDEERSRSSQASIDIIEQNVEDTQ
jgi:hypothetical protein